MNLEYNTPEADHWLCAKCMLPLEVGKVNIGYHWDYFLVDLPRCPNCGQVFISEELAMGKMVEVEEMLEDK